MSTDPTEQLIRTLEDWEAQYEAARAQLNLQAIHTLRTRLAQMLEMVERDATGPSSSPITAPDDHA